MIRALALAVFSVLYSFAAGLPGCPEAVAAGEELLSKGRLKEAQAAFAQALGLAILNSDAQGEGKARIGLGKSLDGLGEYQSAKGHLEKALAICRRMHDKNGEADSLETLGAVSGDLGQMTEAAAQFEKALGLYAEGGNLNGQAKALNDLGLASSCLGQKAKALDCYERAVSLYVVSRDLRGEAETLNNIGVVYQELGQMDRALTFLERSLEVRTRIGDRAGIASSLSNIGVVLEQNGQAAKALTYLEKALVLRREVGDRPGEATTLNNIGKIYHSIGQPRKALGYYERDLAISREIGDRYGETTTLNNLGRIHEGLGDRARCLEYDEKALALRRELGDRGGEAQSLSNLGRLYAAMGERDKGLAYLGKALGIQREVGDRRGEAVVLSGMGHLFLDLGQHEKAQDCLARALPIHREVGNRDMEAQTQGYLGRLAEALHQPSLAVFYGKHCVSGYQALRGELRTLSPDARKSYLQTIEQAYRVLAARLLRQGRGSEAQQVISLLKEQEYFDYAQGSGKEGQVLPSVEWTGAEAHWNLRLQRVLGETARLGGAVTVLQIKKRSPEEELRLRSLQPSLDASQHRLEATLASMAKGLARAGQAPLVSSFVKALWRDLRAMGAGTAVVYTFLAEERTWLLGVTPGEIRVWEVKVGLGDLEAMVKAFGSGLQNPRRDPRPEGLALYRTVVAPLSTWRKDRQIQRMLWSLDGPLRYVSLGALWNGRSYLVEEMPVSVFTPAARMNLARGVKSRKTLGVGISRAAGEFAALPNVPAELHSIVKEQGHPGGVVPGQLLLDEGFTEAHLRTGLKQGYPVLHVASHFNLSAEGEKESFLLLGDGRKWDLEAMRTGEPLFGNLDMLVLSACQTALGTPGPLGREIEGFGVMAQRQGAHTVIASLWPVADVSTGALMQRFYRAWAQGASKADALRSAQLDLLRGRVGHLVAGVDRGGRLGEKNPQGGVRFVASPKAPLAHPFYWAPFVLMGDWR